jgi:putative addiction module component (TIGR02574 family)
MRAAEIPQLQGLSIGEKLQLVEELWDEIAEAGEAVPLPEWHKRALDESLEEYRKNPREGSAWAEARMHIRGRKTF